MSELALLPTELLLLVGSYLTPAAAGCLALTSRQMYLNIHTTNVFNQLEFDTEQRIDFLVHLDSALPNHQLCHECGIFHPRRYRCPDHKKSDYGWLKLSFGKVYWPTLQMAMRALKYGKKYGATTTLNRKPSAPSREQWSTGCRAIRAGNRLLIEEKFQKVYDSPWSCPSGDEPRMCLHTRASFTSWPGIRGLFGELRSYPGYLVSSDAYICPHCPCEMRITVEPHETFFLWTFHRYLDLGDCLKPSRREWLLLCSGYKDAIDELLRSTWELPDIDDYRSISKAFGAKCTPASTNYSVKYGARYLADLNFSPCPR